MENEIEVEVFKQEEHDGEWPPENAADCLAWLSEKIGTVPDEFRDSTKVVFDGVPGYEGTSYGRVAITYTRPETDAEKQARVVEYVRKRSAQIERERAEFYRLNEKYGPGG